MEVSEQKNDFSPARNKVGSLHFGGLGNLQRVRLPDEEVSNTVCKDEWRGYLRGLVLSVTTCFVFRSNNTVSLFSLDHPVSLFSLGRFLFQTATQLDIAPCALRLLTLVSWYVLSLLALQFTPFLACPTAPTVNLRPKEPLVGPPPPSATSLHFSGLNHSASRPCPSYLSLNLC